MESVFWAITLTLFLGGTGLPLPENPILMGGGYAIFKRVTPPAVSLIVWYLAIVAGDAFLFAVSHWFFTRPTVAAFLKRVGGVNRLEAYRKAFAVRGGWTLFLARFTFGFRAVAYIAAGVAHYPWKRFLLVDGLSVALQVILFVGVGYFAGEKIDWAENAAHKIILFLGILAVISLLITWLASYLVHLFTDRSRPQNQSGVSEARLNSSGPEGGRKKEGSE
ncbi:MAG: DedA family protein [Desulfobacterales bacterium]